MDLQKLKENVVEETIEYRDQQIKLEIAPDIYTSEDAELGVAEYVAKGLKSWDITDNKVSVPINAETLTTVIPDGLVTVMFDRILSLKEAAVGKLKILGKSASG